MLRSLHVRHFAIVKSLDLDFACGTTAFTGETGAGKSIMIDALTLALGGRGEASVVRTGRTSVKSQPFLALTTQQNPKLGCNNTRLLLKRMS